MSKRITRIQADFPVPLEITREQERRFHDLLAEICRDYERAHPGRIMWVAGWGDLIVYMPWTAEEEKERGMEFDDSVLAAEICEREARPGERDRRKETPQ